MKDTIVDATITYRKEPTLDEIAEFVKQLALEKILADPKALAAIAAAIKDMERPAREQAHGGEYSNILWGDENGTFPTSQDGEKG